MKTSYLGNIPEIHDLTAFFSLMFMEPDESTVVPFDRRAVPYLLCYMFKVPIPEVRTSHYGYLYTFTDEDIAAIQSQVEGMPDKLKYLDRRYISLSTLLLLTNSPRFPYIMHVSRVMKGSEIYTCYDFILKLDIVAPEPMKEI